MVVEQLQQCGTYEHGRVHEESPPLRLDKVLGFRVDDVVVVLWLPGFLHAALVVSTPAVFLW